MAIVLEMRMPAVYGSNLFRRLLIFAGAFCFVLTIGNVQLKLLLGKSEILGVTMPFGEEWSTRRWFITVVIVMVISAFLLNLAGEAGKLSREQALASSDRFVKEAFPSGIVIKRIDSANDSTYLLCDNKIPKLVTVTLFNDPPKILNTEQVDSGLSCKELLQLR